MPRKKTENMKKKGIALRAPYPPNKSNDAAWKKCLDNSALVHILLFRDPSPLNWGPIFDFETEEAKKLCWERNKDLIMSLRGEGWICEDFRKSRRQGYYVGNRPWAYFQYDLKVDFDFTHAFYGFQKAQFFYLKESNLLEPDEEQKVKYYCEKMAEEYKDNKEKIERHTLD